MSLVEVRPIDKEKWHKKTGVQNFSQPKVIEVSINSSTREYNTGMTDEEEETYSKKLGVTLSKRVSDPNLPHPYYSSKVSWITLPYRTTIFDTSKPDEFVKVKNMRASKFVANSLKELEEGKFPEATHVIYDENEDIDNQATKIEQKEEAYAKLSKMSLESKTDVLQIITKKSAKGKSSNFVNVKLSQEIDSDPEGFLRVVKFGPEDVSIRAKVLELLDMNILVKDAGGIFFMGDLIALNYEDVVTWFKDPNNQVMKVRILEMLQKK